MLSRVPSRSKCDQPASLVDCLLFFEEGRNPNSPHQPGWLGFCDDVDHLDRKPGAFSCFDAHMNYRQALLTLGARVLIICQALAGGPLERDGMVIVDQRQHHKPVLVASPPTKRARC